VTDYSAFNQEELMNLLATHTAEYTRIYSEGIEPEKLDYLKKAIISIQNEIKSRKKKDSSHN
jgi:hypothetical protein